MDEKHEDTPARGIMITLSGMDVQGEQTAFSGTAEDAIT
jgi:hypothetical protein